MKKLTLLCLLLISQAASATVTEQLDYAYYTVSADPNRSLLSVVNEASPIHEYGKTFHGQTHWNVSWHFWWHERRDGRCQINKVNTEVTATIQLPHLVNPTAQQEEQFNRYLAALRVHELGHVDNGRQAGMEIDRGITALPEMENCGILDTTANALAHAILKQYHDKDIQYDAATSHGKTQGAVLSN
jgi:predicted secreted Zn-dependent protease